MRDDGGGRVEIRLPAYGPDDRGPAPAGQLRRDRGDAAQHSLHQDGLSGDGAVAEDRSIGGDAGNAEAGTDLVAHPVGQVDCHRVRNDRPLGRSAERPIQLGAEDLPGRSAGEIEVLGRFLRTADTLIPELGSETSDRVVTAAWNEIAPE